MSILLDKLSIPVIVAPMFLVSSVDMVIASSKSGVVGSIPMLNARTAEECEEMLKQLKEALPTEPWAVNFIAHKTNKRHDSDLALIKKYQPPIVIASLGHPGVVTEVVHSYGGLVFSDVATVKHAKKAEASGADIIIAEGFEAAGINSSLELTTFVLIPQIANAVSIPVVAAGGIGDGKGLAAAFMLGASGVQMGTRLIATQDGQFSKEYKEKLVTANGLDTQIVGRSVGRVRRILKTGYTEKLLKAEAEGISLEEFNEMTSEDKHIKGAIDGDTDNGFINSGQVVGLITNIPTVKELFASMIEEAAVQMDAGFRKLALVSSK